MSTSQIAKNIIKTIIFLIVFTIGMVLTAIDLILNHFPLGYFLQFGSIGYLIYFCALIILPTVLFFLFDDGGLTAIACLLLVFSASFFLYQHQMKLHPEYDTSPAAIRKLKEAK